MAQAALAPQSELSKERADFYRRVAKAKYAYPSNDDIEVDDDALYSVCGEDNGVWIEGWLWIPMRDKEE